MIYIFDLDGTLSDCTHRLPLLQERRWDEFYDRCDGDLPIPHVIGLFNTLYWDGHDIRIWSGRVERVRGKTMDWLESHVTLPGEDVQRSELRMRPDRDFSSGAKLKQQWLLSLEPRVRALIACAFEDDPKCAEMYRSHGVPCLLIS